jgi:hypothetical protein
MAAGRSTDPLVLLRDPAVDLGEADWEAKALRARWRSCPAIAIAPVLPLDQFVYFALVPGNTSSRT